MVFLLNLIFAVLAFVVICYVVSKAGAERPVQVVLGVLVAVVVYIGNFASQVVK